MVDKEAVPLNARRFQVNTHVLSLEYFLNQLWFLATVEKPGTAGAPQPTYPLMLIAPNVFVPAFLVVQTPDANSLFVAGFSRNLVKSLRLAVAVL